VSLLEIRGLTAAYGPVKVIHGVDLSVEDFEAVVVLGANGSGKTTMLRAISGMVATQGTLEFDGRSLRGKKPEQVAKLGIAHVPQGRGTLAELTVDENLRLGAYTRRDDRIEADMERHYESFPRLAKRRSQRAGTMSGGEQQMLAIARALMLRPRLLLLDEPSLGLAPLVTRELFETLGRLNRELGTAMLIVEQNAALALEVASRGYVLEAGLVVAAGSAAELSSADEVRKAYLGL
jgi:branched-chain amino acid transport system ATP-binding protein